MEGVINVVIADSSDSFRSILAELIDGEEDMSVSARASDGLQAMELVQELRPDVLVTDLMLRGMEGMHLIRSLKQEGTLPRTIVVSGFFNDRLAEEVSSLGVEYFFPKPCRITELIQRIRECGDEAEAESEDAVRARLAQRVDTLAKEVLQGFGIPPHLYGHGYLREAMVRLIAYDYPLKGITKILYPDIAKASSTDPHRVERCIRHAIQTGWDEGDASEREQMFGTAFSHSQRQPTNSQFLAIAVDWVKEALEKGEDMK